ncbi:hypothetical protein SISNIDRAFT_414319 [Sistotremastrum niveocremeum HHB9708]|uniref:GRAM domain-containing protein n=2 Tax=Sistotremastraceae TaxID=3402574 RepID=A0A164S704_9AGAM|nr:hypothetical protein SISNIDRAFT_414319 [Sistotremastrum niveocremeum HHB9708]KZT36684.1 hypothetical protein SISSUDRAFT_988825 [Sistotremastrum suecicum HHB10207 ss-3]
MASINWAQLDPNSTPILLPNEVSITSIPDGVEATLVVPDQAGQNGGSERRSKEVGRLFLTDRRVIFVVPEQYSRPSFRSLSIPLLAILSTSFQQPFFGANYLAMELKPAADGGLVHGTKAEIRFKDRPMFEFISILEKSREREQFRKRETEFEDELRMCCSFHCSADRSLILNPLRAAMYSSASGSRVDTPVPPAPGPATTTEAPPSYYDG